MNPPGLHFLRPSPNSGYIATAMTLLQQHPTTGRRAIVNTVNCAGVMGKGIALEFRNMTGAGWRANLAAYKARCSTSSPESERIKTGRMFLYPVDDLLDGNFLIVNFPTKQHWRNPSRLEYIAEGLDDLARVIRDQGIGVLVMPALGCGNGGLDWHGAVRPLIEARLADSPATLLVFEPPAAA